MTHELPADVRVEVLPDGVRYVLPKRQLGSGRKGGWVLVVVGGLITAFMVAWMVGPFIGGVKMLREGEMFGWALIGFSLLGTMGLVVGVGVLGAGIAILTHVTHSEVELRGGRLRAVERFGWFRWTRQRKAEAIEKLELGEPLIGSDLADKVKGLSKQEGQTPPFKMELPEDLATIRAYGRNMKPLIVAPGYPLETLRALAQVLSERMATGGKARLFGADEPRVAIVERTAETAEQREAMEEQAALDRPADAKSTLEQRDDGLTITVPPSGFWRGSKGMGCFAVMWNGFILFFIVMLVLFQLGIIDSDGGDPPGWIGFLFMIPFVAVGVGVGLGALNMGTRRAIIDVVGDTLLVTRRGIFGTKQQEWRADQIDKVIVGSSGMEVNDVPVKELQVHPKEGKKLGLLSQLDNDELRWIAATLRKALGLWQTS